jgi:hypothetical protein
LDDVQRTCDVISLADAARCELLVRRVIDPERLLIVVVGDAKVIGDSLREIAPVTVLDREGHPARKTETGRLKVPTAPSAALGSDANYQH